MKRFKNILYLLPVLALIFLAGCSDVADNFQGTGRLNAGTEIQISKDGEYISKNEVALYIHTYDRLPKNYITKKEAQKLGWDARKGNLDSVAPGKSIGGDRFGNYERLLPENTTYKECDINYLGGLRTAERLIYAANGHIYYTKDHYKTFEQLY